MNIVVCVKQVPDTETRVKLNSDQTWLDESGITFILNPYDEFAVEEALKLKEANDGEVTVICLGPERAQSAIRSALAMGADKAVHIADENLRMSIDTAKALAEVVKPLNPDVVLLGKQSIDTDNAHMASMLGELLDLPSVSSVTKLEISGNSGTAGREIEGGQEVIGFSLPAVISCHKGLNEPRYASLKGIMMSKKKSVESAEAVEAENKVKIKKLEYPPSRPPGKIVGEGPEAAAELAKLLREEAKAI